MKTTLHDVAKLAGVSIKTVSNVIHDHPNVSDETRTKVQKALKDLDYMPNLTARSLRSGKTNVIGLVIPELMNSYFAELANAAMSSAEKYGLNVIIEQTHGERKREIQILENARRNMVDGLIFSPVGLSQEDAEITKVNYPLVLVGERIFYGPNDHVTMKNVAAAKAATEYLIKLGHKRIAILGAKNDSSYSSATLRMQGYQEALKAAGIKFDKDLVIETPEWFRADGAETMTKFLKKKVDFDAVFALNDLLAFGAMRVLQEAGISIPKDVSVIGFDNLDEANYSIPTLTSVEPGKQTIAETAVSTLVERIGLENQAEIPPREIEVDFAIVQRGSTITKR